MRDDMSDLANQMKSCVEPAVPDEWHVARFIRRMAAMPFPCSTAAYNGLTGMFA
jgi:hypothetical protein